MFTFEYKYIALPGLIRPRLDVITRAEPGIYDRSRTAPSVDCCALMALLLTFPIAVAAEAEITTLCHHVPWRGPFLHQRQFQPAFVASFQACGPPTNYSETIAVAFFPVIPSDPVVGPSHIITAAESALASATSATAATLTYDAATKKIDPFDNDTCFYYMPPLWHRSFTWTLSFGT
jgi:hypothetical protein